MCGFAGAFHASHNHSFLPTTAVLRALKNRGPDSLSVDSGPGWMIVRSRLAIRNEDSEQYDSLLPSVALVGELIVDGSHPTNERRLVAELVSNNRSGWFDGLDGMFSIAAVNHKREALLLARDELGIKPLFYFKSDNAIYFGSTPLLALGMAEHEVRTNADHATNISSFGFSSDDELPQLGVQQVPHGSTVEVVRDRSTLRSKVRRQRPLVVEESSDDPVQLWAALCEESTRFLTDVGDSEVALAYSGGVDSTLLLLALIEAGHKPVAVSLCSGEARARYLRSVCDTLGVESLIISSTDALTSAAASTSLELSSIGSKAALLVCTEAKRKYPRMRVVVFGEGADEVFDGYHWSRRPAERMARMGAVARRLDRNNAATSLSGNILGSCLEMANLAGPELNSRAASWSRDLDMGVRLRNNHLLPLDLAAASTGLEAQVPYLGPRMRNRRSPLSWPQGQGELKMPLRTLLRSRLPTELRAMADAPKRPFPADFNDLERVPAGSERSGPKRVIGTGLTQ